ncbi:MAG: hypothetical protein HFI50_00810 [Lachnospiraceae bacterium]|nr:hypothetical protein [Lachnospiraceae bacterium]
MLEIQRLKVTIITDNGTYGFDENFTRGLNFIASTDNTCGKSSILEAIYYCLGFEEIIGGQTEKVLTPVYKSNIKDEEEEYAVLQSSMLLQISNGHDVITIMRSAKMENRKSKLITVFYSPIDNIYDKDTDKDDMYVHSPNAAQHEKGFHAFLEKFVGMTLPVVATTDSTDRKLYLQLIFSGMFIEQKRGWADFFSAMPYLGIKDSKKRIIEYLIGLETLSNEKKRNELGFEERAIRQDWGSVIREINAICFRENCQVQGIPTEPQVIEVGISNITNIVKNTEGGKVLEKYIASLREEYDNLFSTEPKVADNYEQIEEELRLTEEAIDNLEQQRKEAYQKFMAENLAINKLNANLETIRVDISNNKDAKKLRDLGAEVDSLALKDICPVCHQKIQDALFPEQDAYIFMSIEENIRHLNAQGQVFEYALKSHQENKRKLDALLTEFQAKLSTLNRLAKALRNDIYAVDDEYAESVVYKKIEISKEIEDLEKLQSNLQKLFSTMDALSVRWKKYLEDKEKLPKKKFSADDDTKITTLRNVFIKNLRRFGYKSLTTMEQIEISKDTYLPVRENFDMKFDSSASDGIRAIWAFTLALMQTSIIHKGNHPNILMYDEPDQHSIVMKDLKSFFDTIIEINVGQTIVAITIKDSDTEEAIAALNPDSYNIIRIGKRAFVKMSEKVE